jgi:hypothetical protein
MNCCGNKRKEWMNEMKSSAHQETTEKNSDLIISDNPDRVFEYTGSYSLTINGAVSGKSYHFRFQGEKIKVDYSDSFAMMAERDLKVSTEPQKAAKL